MPPLAASSEAGGPAASGAFGPRASRIIGNAALYQLVQEVAEAVDAQERKLQAIHELCTRILEKLA
jgi:hypothetical protein